MLTTVRTPFGDDGNASNVKPVWLFGKRNDDRRERARNSEQCNRRERADVAPLFDLVIGRNFWNVAPRMGVDEICQLNELHRSSEPTQATHDRLFSRVPTPVRESRRLRDHSSGWPGLVRSILIVRMGKSMTQLLTTPAADLVKSGRIDVDGLPPIDWT